MNKQKARMAAAISRQMNAGNWKGAEANLLIALRSFPRDYGFLRLLGMAKDRQNQPKEAARYFKKALKAEPKSADALNNMGIAELKLGNRTAAFSNFSKATRLELGHPKAWFLLAKIHLLNDQPEKAIEALERSYRLEPDSLETVAELLSVLERSNHIEKMDTLLAEAAGLSADHPMLKLFGGISSYRKKDFSACKDMLEAITFEGPNANKFRSFELLRVRYLGKACDALKLSEPAFAYFAKAKQTNKQLFSNNLVDPNAYRRLLDGHQDYLDSYDPAFERVALEAEDEPVFMVGFPRSGTTLLDTFLRGSREISVLEEKPTVSALLKALGTYGEAELAGLDTIDLATLKQARQDYWAAVRTFKPTGLVVDKLPLNLVHTAEILRVFPKAKFVLVIRDPADSVFSCYMQTFSRNNSMASLDSPLEAAKTYNSAMQIWEKSVELFQPSYIISRYEDLIEDPERSLRKTIDFLGVDWDEAMLDHRGTAKGRDKINTPSYSQVVEPLYETAVARWERYAHLMPEALEILHPWRQHFGYSD